MACCPTKEKYGYEDSRFEKDVDENFHCSICYNVLKEPRRCMNNDHVFCLGCITEHLKVNSQTCPECNEHLSVDTLRRPRVVNNMLSKLKINCDYASRGCPQFTCLEDLEAHVANCGYAPVLCSNAECGMVINKQDKVHHETEVCDYRNMKRNDCGQIQEDIGILKGSLIELDGKVEVAVKAIKNMDKKVETAVKEMNDKVEASAKKINEKVAASTKAIKEKVEASTRKMNEKVEASSRKMNEKVEVSSRKISEKVEASSRKMNEKVNESSGEMKKEIGEVKKEVKDMKENLSKVSKDVDEVKVMIIQMLEKFNMLELLNKPPSPTEGMLNTPREDVLIAGGLVSRNFGKNSEIYSWEKNCWFEVLPTNGDYLEASSFTYKDQFFVVGGITSNAIEALNVNELPLKWTKVLGELPHEFSGHQTVVCQQSVIQIGGFQSNTTWSNVISELQLTSPFILRKLCQMPRPRGYHCAEVFEDKVMILGGYDGWGPTDSVFEFDPKRNECKEMPKLPFALCGMATVRWRDEVVVLGGLGKYRQKLNDVFMYHPKTGKITALPSMLEKREGHCAVITRNTIVVMGGWNENKEYLSSAEFFTMGGSTWEYLPAMNKTRFRAVAKALPFTRKYV